MMIWGMDRAGDGPTGRSNTVRLARRKAPELRRERRGGFAIVEARVEPRLAQLAAFSSLIKLSFLLISIMLSLYQSPGKVDERISKWIMENGRVRGGLMMLHIDEVAKSSYHILYDTANQVASK